MLPVTLKNEALKLWLTGMPEDEIARTLKLERSAIETCRLEERWDDLRGLTDLAVLIRNETKGDEEDDRAVRLADIAEHIAGKIMSKGVPSITAAELNKLLVALKRARDIRQDVRRSRNIRYWARKHRPQQW